MAKITVTATLIFPDTMPGYALEELERLASMAAVDHGSAIGFLQKLVEWAVIDDEVRLTVQERGRHH